MDLIRGGGGGGLISDGACNRNKKAVSKRAIAVLFEIRFSFTSF